MAVAAAGKARRAGDAGAEVVRRLEAVHRELRAFQPPGFGPPVHGPPVPSRIFLIGQAPGPHEAKYGRPFAWTAGKTLFRWLGEATGADEATLRERIYISAVVRCFPGKAPGGGDRLPSPAECAQWRGYVAREVEILEPRLVIPVGRLAISEVMGHAEPIAAVVGKSFKVQYHGVHTEVLPLPHPSGASTWFKVEPGKTLLAQALRRLAEHPEVRRAFRRRAR
ncbi:MAG: uracil-DNA glycosylase family protein [Anaeromyxobacter sp.]